MDNWLMWDIIVRQAAADRARWANTMDMLDSAGVDRRGGLRAGLASLLARAAIYLDRDAGRATLAGAPNH
jgi:hypothetical protein